MIHQNFGKYSERGLKVNASYANLNRINMQGENSIVKTNEKVKCRYKPECLHLEIWEDMGKYLNYT